MRVRVGIVVAAALLLGGCGSSPAAAPQTVVATRTAPGPTVTATTTEQITSTSTAETTVIESTSVRLTATVVKTASVTVTPKPVTRVVPTTVVRTATVTEEPPPPAGSVPNGNYLVGTEIQPGNYKCSAGDASDVFWETNSSTNDIVDNGFGLIAFISGDAYSVQLERCEGTWEKIS